VASGIGGVGLAGGLAVAISGPSLLPVIADSVTIENRTRMFGWVQTVWTIALATGAALALLPAFLQGTLGIGDYDAHSLSYYLMAGLVLASIVPILVIREHRTRSVKSPIESDPLTGVTRPPALFAWTAKINFSRFTSSREIKRFIGVYALAGLGLGVSVQLIATWYALAFHATEGAAGQWIFLADLFSASSILFIPSLVRKYGTLKSTVITSAIGALFLGVMPLSNIFVIAASLFVVRSVFVNISWPILQSYIMGVVDEGERAAATGIATTAWGITVAAGTVIGGLLFSAGLLYLPFVIGFVAYLVSALALGYFFKGIKPPEENNSMVSAF
jgi:MFS family permease